MESFRTIAELSKNVKKSPNAKTKSKILRENIK